VRIYTRAGDDGTTGLYFGGRVGKDSAVIELNGAVDEAQAHLGMARALAGEDSLLGELLIGVEQDLWILMAEVATAPDNRRKLVPGKTLVTTEMVTAVEEHIDFLSNQMELPKEFFVPGETPLAASLDLARTVIRRAERLAVTSAPSGSEIVPYLNRLSDLAWTMARWAEGTRGRTVHTES
jgi:cob(I)alamin adenosyltransferase